MKGKIIVIEGTDCSGKETQSRLLEKKLNDKNLKCIRFEFPNYGSPTGRIIGGAYLGKEEISESYFKEGAPNVDPYVVSLYYAADRKYNIEKINKYLNDGYYVIIDRYTASNMAHQGGKIHDKEQRFFMYQWIDKLEYWLLQLPKPDITIFLHMPYEYAKELKRNRRNMDEHEKSEKHLRNAEEAYIELSELYNWAKIECVANEEIKSTDTINDEIVEILKKSEVISI